jgi:antitoxin component of MazEF toxin-antitoxin module
MDNKIKEITRLGNSAGVVVDKEMLYKAELKVGDKVEVICKKNQITLKKVKDEE